MSVKEIITLKNDKDGILRAKTKPVEDVASVAGLVKDMLDTTASIGCLGLAANQIGASAAVMVISVGEPIVVINPTLIAKADRATSINEGCLSTESRRNIKRFKRVTIEGIDTEGNKIRIKSKGKLEAFAIQHELDHLEGITIEDKR